MAGIGRFGTTPYEGAIAEVKQDLLLEQTTDHDLFLEIKMDEAIRSIDSLEGYEKETATLDIVDGRVQLPCGFMKLYGARFSSNGNCMPIPYIERDFINSCGCDAYSIWGGAGGGYEISGNWMIFHSPLDETYDQVNIGYLKRATDEQGRPLMLTSHVRAAKAYATWKYCFSYARVQPSPALMQMMMNMARSAQMEFARQKAMLRGQAQSKRWDEDKRQVGMMFNAWITSDYMMITRQRIA